MKPEMNDDEFQPLTYQALAKASGRVVAVGPRAWIKSRNGARGDDSLPEILKGVSLPWQDPWEDFFRPFSVCPRGSRGVQNFWQEGLKGSVVNIYSHSRVKIEQAMKKSAGFLLDLYIMIL